MVLSSPNKMRHGRAHVAIANPHLWLERHAVPGEAELLDKLIQPGNAQRMGFGIQPDHDIVPRQVVDALIVVQALLQPLR